jgi:hypothetical protein
MNPIKSLLLASLALAAPLAARAEISAAAWLETYYLNPAPEELPRTIRRLAQSGYFEQPGHTALAIGFIATVFAQSPDRVDGWLVQLNGLSLRHNRLLACALWQAGHPLGPELLRLLSQNSPLREEVERLANLPSQPIAETPVHSESSMNLQWGAFLASGDERHILCIFDAIGLDEPALTAKARLALAQNAAAHPRVLEICRAQLERQPEEVRGVLRAAVQAAAPARGPRS